MIEAINARPAPIIAVDLPSGINGTSGAVMGAAVKATRTVTFFRKKARSSAAARPAALRQRRRRRYRDSRDRARARSQPRPSKISRRCGRKAFRCRGMTGTNTTAAMRSWCPARRGRPGRRGSQHAARYAPGPGLVTIASPREALAVNAATSLAVMVRPVDGAAELDKFLADRRLNALAIGPRHGRSEATCELVLAALAGERAVVLDADAITSFSERPSDWPGAESAAGRPRS